MGTHEQKRHDHDYALNLTLLSKLWQHRTSGKSDENAPNFIRRLEQPFHVDGKIDMDIFDLTDTSVSHDQSSSEQVQEL